VRRGEDSRAENNTAAGQPAFRLREFPGGDSHRFEAAFLETMPRPGKFGGAEHCVPHEQHVRGVRFIGSDRDDVAAFECGGSDPVGIDEDGRPPVIDRRHR
jgi:hypothetical protein